MVDCVILSIVNCWLKNDSYDSMSGLASDWIILWFFFPWDKNCARLLRMVSVNHQKNLSLPPSSAQIVSKWTKSPFPRKIEKSENWDVNSNWPPFLKSIFPQPTHFNPKIASCCLANKHFCLFFKSLDFVKIHFYFFWFRVDFFRIEISQIGDPTLKCWLLIGWSEAWRSKFKKTESTKEKYQKWKKNEKKKLKKN